MLKRNCTPSLTHRKKCELIPHPAKKKITIESDLLILPFLKNNIEENKMKNDIIKKNIKSSKKLGKNRLSIDCKNNTYIKNFEIIKSNLEKNYNIKFKLIVL